MVGGALQGGRPLLRGDGEMGGERGRWGSPGRPARPPPLDPPVGWRGQRPAAKAWPIAGGPGVSTETFAAGDHLSRHKPRRSRHDPQPQGRQSVATSRE